MDLTSQIQDELLLQDLSLAYCELTSMLFMTTHTSPKMTRGATGQNKKERNLSIEMKRVGDYVIQALQGTVAYLLYFLPFLSRPCMLTLFVFFFYNRSRRLNP